MLATSLYGIKECGERQMLVQHFERLSSDDLLLLDRDYPSRWLVAPCALHEFVTCGDFSKHCVM